MIAIGDKVVCIYDFRTTKEFYRPNGAPQKEKVYCVDGFYIGGENELGLKLVGLKTIYIASGTEVGWAAYRFRKLEEVKMENELNHYKSTVIEQ